MINEKDIKIILFLIAFQKFGRATAAVNEMNEALRVMKKEGLIQ